MLICVTPPKEVYLIQRKVVNMFACLYFILVELFTLRNLKETIYSYILAVPIYNETQRPKITVCTQIKGF
jgi:hypothetical protein